MLINGLELFTFHIILYKVFSQSIESVRAEMPCVHQALKWKKCQGEAWYIKMADKMAVSVSQFC